MVEGFGALVRIFEDFYGAVDAVVAGLSIQLGMSAELIENHFVVANEIDRAQITSDIDAVIAGIFASELVVAQLRMMRIIEE